MDKNIRDREINKKPLVPQFLSNNNQNYKTSQSTSTKTKNNEENNQNNNTDYKNISLSMTGEISSDYIYRNSLKQKQSNVTHVEEPEDDDEQFISNMKMIIDKNYMQNKENYSIRDLQSKSYLSRKKKCAFSDEDQNLIKRFKKSVEESKVSCVAPQKLQQSEQIASVHSRHASTTCTPQITPIVGHNDTDMNFRCNTEKLLFHAASETQRNDQCITPEIAKTITEIEIEQLIFHEMEYFTPPQKDDLSFIKKI